MPYSIMVMTVLGKTRVYSFAQAKTARRFAARAMSLPSVFRVEERG